MKSHCILNDLYIYCVDYHTEIRTKVLFFYKVNTNFWLTELLYPGKNALVSGKDFHIWQQRKQFKSIQCILVFLFQDHTWAFFLTKHEIKFSHFYLFIDIDILIFFMRTLIGNLKKALPQGSQSLGGNRYAINLYCSNTLDPKEIHGTTNLKLIYV